MTMIDFGSFAVSGGVLGSSLNDASVGVFSIDTEYDTPDGPLKYKAIHIGLLIAEIRILIPRKNG
jgi:hypothetical protein